MKRWIYDTEKSTTKTRLSIASRLGFERLLTPPRNNMKSLGGWCEELNIGLMPIIADWHNIKQKHPEMAFLNHEGKSSFDSQDPLVPSNDWASWWCPEAIDLIREDFGKAAKQAGNALAGFVIGIGSGDASCMPINWHRQPDGNDLCRDYWVFDDWALAAYEEMYGPGAVPVPHPKDDENLRTLNFIQTAMIRRMDEMAKLAVEYTNEVWVMVLPFCDNSHIGMAAGYAFGFHHRLADWAHSFNKIDGGVINFLMPHIFKDDVPNQVAQAAAMCDTQGLDCECLVCAEVAGPDWKDNLHINKKRIQDLGLTGMLCDPIHVTDPQNEKDVGYMLNGTTEEKEETSTGSTPCVECSKKKIRNPLIPLSVSHAPTSKVVK